MKENKIPMCIYHELNSQATDINWLRGMGVDLDRLGFTLSNLRNLTQLKKERTKNIISHIKLLLLQR